MGIDNPIEKRVALLRDYAKIKNMSDGEVKAACKNSLMEYTGGIIRIAIDYTVSVAFTFEELSKIYKSI